MNSCGVLKALGTDGRTFRSWVMLLTGVILISIFAEGKNYYNMCVLSIHNYVW